MIPDGGAHAISIVFILVMMEVVISPKTFHPFKGWIPGVNGVMHRPIHQVSQDETRKEHKSVLAHQQVHLPEERRSYN